MKATKNIILSHAGKQHSYFVAKAMNELGFLKKYYTSTYVSNKLLQFFIERTNNQFWSRRFIKGIDGNLVEANWRFELKAFINRKLKGNSFAVEKMVYEHDERFDAYMAKKLSKMQSSIFWGFQGSSLNSIKAIRKNNGFAICELSTAHVTYAKKILKEEQELHPLWADTITNVAFPAAYEKRLEQEPIAANIVIAASAFTKKTLTESGIAANKIYTLPLGASVEHIKYIPDKSKTGRPLKLLYAGTVTQRKGIYYLLEAMKKFNNNDVELHIIGNTFGTNNEFQKYSSFYNYHGPLSQQQLFQKYCEYDALVLPTIFEGFALVIVEAMAAGLPVITTEHSIGPDIIENDKNGFIIPIREIDSIVSSIHKLQSKNDSEWKEMQKNARSAALNYSWDNYKIRLNNFLTNLEV